METTPRSLLERLRLDPDEVAWRRLVALYDPFLHGILKGQGLDPGDADDLIQEVFLVVHQEIAAFDHNQKPGAFRRWLRQVLINRLLGHWRRRDRTRGKADAGADDPPLDQIAAPVSDLEARWDREHDQYVARRLLELLEPEFTRTTWLAFRRVVMDRAPAAQVAAELGISPNAVHIARSRVLKRMREEIEGLVE